MDAEKERVIRMRRFVAFTLAWIFLFVFVFLSIAERLKERLRRLIASILVLVIVTGIVNAGSIYFTYDINGNKTVTKELYMGGEIHFPKSIADRIKVNGGIVINETESEWVIKATSSVVTVEYVKLTNTSFSYAKKIYNAKPFPKELYKPVTPDELRLALINLSQFQNDVNRKIGKIEAEIHEIKQKPTAGQELMSFLSTNPVALAFYVFIFILAIIALLGWLYERRAC